MLRVILILILVLLSQAPMYIGDLSLNFSVQNIMVFSIISIAVYGVSHGIVLLLKLIIGTSFNQVIVVASTVLICLLWFSIYIYNTNSPYSFAVHDEVWFALKHCFGIIGVFGIYKATSKYA